MMQRLGLLAIGVLCLSLVACADSDVYAPVADISGYEAIPKSGKYRVVAGDTLYSIAWRYGSDYQVLAENNDIAAPYDIQRGQTIYLRGKPQKPAVVVAKPQPKPITAKAPVKKTPKRPTFNAKKEPNYSIKRWGWPAKGKVLAAFSSKNKGIDIGGTIGAPVYAAAPGKVVYAGDGLRGYGNLIILKHNSKYLSAYAYNSRLKVREGQWVKKGQVIAAMGRSARQHPSLHFEIRRAGMPVNPLKLLKK